MALPGCGLLKESSVLGAGCGLQQFNRKPSGLRRFAA
jgi:hypothetical protein